MTLKNSLEAKIQYRIKRSKRSVFMISDFSDLSDPNQIGRVFRTLVKKQLVVKIGHGVFAKAKISSVTQKVIPVKDLPALGIEVVKKLGLKTVQTEYEKAYQEGRSTQVPTGRVIGVKGRISRKIGFNDRYIIYQSMS